MIHLAGPVLLAAVLAGVGVYGLLARRHVVMVLIGAELLLNAVNVIFVAFGSVPGGLLAAHTAVPATADPTGSAGVGPAVVGPAVVDPVLAGQSMAVFVITIAAAETVVALAITLTAFRQSRRIDLDEPSGEAP